jgi:hypothetical protein
LPKERYTALAVIPAFSWLWCDDASLPRCCWAQRTFPAALLRWQVPGGSALLATSIRILQRWDGAL